MSSFVQPESTICIQQPKDIINLLNPAAVDYSLFLDIDGTLADFCDDPEQSFIPKTTLQAIKQIIHLGVPVIAVTGRHVQVAKQLFEQIQLPIAGLHGLTIVLDESRQVTPDLTHINFTQLKQRLESACATYPQLLLEDKLHSFALHYRQCPQLGPTAIEIMQLLQADYPAMKLNQGKCVIEILPRQADKGYAIETITQLLGLNKTRAIFVGDDVTDETGFEVVNRLGGISIKVGQGHTIAQYRLQDPQAVADFLVQFQQILDADVLPDGRHSMEKKHV